MAVLERATRRSAGVAVLPGLGLTAGLAAVATGLGRLVPVVGAPVVAIVLGVLLSRCVRDVAAVRPGVACASTAVLQVAVVLLGAQLSLREVARVGLSSLPVMLGTLTVCLGLGQLVGRRLGVEPDLRTLISVGTGICGASAIAAVSPVLRARSASVAYAVSTIFLFNVAAVLAFPPLGHLLGLGQHQFGLLSGTAVNDTSSVVAAATSYGDAATGYAVVVKLTRTLLIIPICIALAALVARRDRNAGSDSSKVRIGRLVPWFLVGFLVLAAANSAGLVPAAAHARLPDVAGFLVTVALAGIGLSTDGRELRRAGIRPPLLGLVLWVAVAATSLVLQAL